MGQSKCGGYYSCSVVFFYVACGSVCMFTSECVSCLKELKL